MRIKDIPRTSNLSWSPYGVYPMLLVAGTSAKQLDASFSSSSYLEVIEVDPSTKGWDMPVRGSLKVTSRFNSVKWGPSDREYGVIAGGGNNGIISLWDPSQIVAGENEALIAELPEHSGPVTSLDFNPTKSCLLASGTSSSEIHIVDINNPTVLMTPGPKAQPEDQVVALAWNKQVEHILCSTHPSSSRCIVWDLRKNEAIIQVSDATNRVRYSCVAWHPNIPTQLVTCSDEDRYPVIQQWDLRYATAPTMVMEGHQRGIQTLTWCESDNDLLLTSSRDDKVICWNPNTNAHGGDRLAEFCAPSQWTFDMAWCPRNPCLFASSSFSGRLSVVSLFGGNEVIPEEPLRVRKNSDPFAANAPILHQPMHIPALTKAPKWLMKPCGASFAFGGRLISFQVASAEVTISQINADPDLSIRSKKLENALQENTMAIFCAEKVEQSEHDDDKQIWNFLKSTFDSKPRQRYLELIGYSVDNLSELAKGVCDGISEATYGSDIAIINKSDAESCGSDEGSNKDLIEIQEDYHDDSRKQVVDLSIDVDSGLDGLICRAMLLGQFEMVVELCVRAGRMADALAVAMAGGRELFQKTQLEYFRQSTSPSAAVLSCIISQKWSTLVESVPLKNWKEALAILLSYAKPTEFNALCDSLAARLVNAAGYELEASLCYICSGNVAELLKGWSGTNIRDEGRLQELVERIMCLQSTSNDPPRGQHVFDTLLKYSKTLAEQGQLTDALAYISATPPEEAVEFKYQLHVAINDPSLSRPPVPYQRLLLESSSDEASVRSSYAPIPSSSMPCNLVTPSLVSDTIKTSKVTYQAPTFSTPESSKSPPISDVGFGHSPTIDTGIAPPPSYVAPTLRSNDGSVKKSSDSTFTPYFPSLPTESRTPSKLVERINVAWNDPPILKNRAKSSQPMSTTRITAPVTSDPVKQHDLSDRGVTPENFTEQPTSPLPLIVEKPPVPEQHGPMLRILENAALDCKNITTSPTQKRKLEEVSIKLEALKDQLRYGSVSGAVVEQLSHIAGALNSKDYNLALYYHTTLAQSCNFSEVSAFLPGIKILLQIGAQLSVAHH